MGTIWAEIVLPLPCACVREATWSDSEIARRCNVNRKLVAEIRKSYMQEIACMDSLNERETANLDAKNAPENRAFVHPKTGSVSPLPCARVREGVTVLNVAAQNAASLRARA